MIRESLASSSDINRQLIRSMATSKEKARTAQFPVAFERSNFRYSYIPFAIVEAVKGREKESRRSIDLSADTDRRRTYSIASSRRPIVNPRPRSLQIYIPTVGILCPQPRFTRFSFLSLPHVPCTDRLSLVASSFLSCIVSCTWLPALRPARPLMCTAGNCAVKSSTYTYIHVHTHTHTYVPLHKRLNW